MTIDRTAFMDKDRCMGSHQVLEEGSELFREDSKLKEGGPHFRVLPTHTVLPKLLHRLDVLLLVVKVG